MKKFREALDLATAIIRTGAFAIGGVCLLVMCVSSDWFPEDMTLGDGVALYFISVGFVLAYAAYWLGITTIGLLLLRWPMELIHLFEKKVPSQAASYALASFKPMWAPPIWVVAGMAAFVVVGSPIRLSLSSALLSCYLAVMQGFFGGMLLVVRRRLQLDDSGISLPDRDNKNRNAMQGLRQVMYVMLAIWILAPMVFGIGHQTLTQAAFRLAQLRKDHATVHIASPWSQLLVKAGLTPNESFLGPNYARFEDVTVRMRSIGSRVVLEVPSLQQQVMFVNIPRQSVEIE